MRTWMEVDPAFDSLLHDNRLLRFEDFFQLPADLTQPCSPHWNRVTSAVRLSVNNQTRRFFLKRLHCMQPEHVIGAIVHGRKPLPQPVHEWHNIAALESAGIHCARRVAVGMQSTCGLPRRAFLLLEEVPAARTLADWLGEGGQVSHTLLAAWQRKRMLVELGMLARRMDNAGLKWLDADQKHIYVRPHPSAHPGCRWEFFLIDVERLEYLHSDGTNTRRAYRNEHLLTMAAAFCDMLDPSATFGDRRQPGRDDLWVLHGAMMPEHGKKDERQTVNRAYLTAVAQCHARRRHSDAPRLLGIPQTGTQSQGGLHIKTDMVSPLGRAGLDSFDALWDYASGDALHKRGLASGRRRDRIEVSDGGIAKRLYLKRYEQRRTLMPAFLASRSRSPAAVERRNIDRMRAAGLPVAEWAACGEGAGSTGSRASLLLLQEVPGRSLEDWVFEWRTGRQPPLATATRHALIHAVAMLTRRMHAAGFFHRDLYLAHVFADLRARQPRLCLIDLARVIKRSGLAMRWRVKDLAALDHSSPYPFVTRTDRIRFLRAYLQQSLDAKPCRPELRLPLAFAFRATHRNRVKSLSIHALGSPRNLIRALATRVDRMRRHDAKHQRAAYKLDNPLPTAADCAKHS